MEAHYSLTDEAFEKQFRFGLLHPSFFSHDAHLRLAWIHIFKYGIESAIGNITEQLRRFTEIHGEQTKYNETVTVAAIKAVNHFMQRTEADNFNDFIEEFPRLSVGFKELLGYHYAFDIFSSEDAKHSYQEPDLLPF